MDTEDSPEAAIDDEKNGDEEGGHLAGINQGVCPEKIEERIIIMQAYSPPK